MKYGMLWGGVLFSALLVGGCATTETAPQMTPLEIQSIQTRSFEAPKTIVFPSAISVFQDLGYTIVSADLNTGLITGESAAANNPWLTFWTGSSEMKQTRSTAFVEEIRGMSTIRINFVEIRETSSGWGRRDRQDIPILDTNIYQNAFERIENAIFLRVGS